MKDDAISTIGGFLFLVVAPIFPPMVIVALLVLSLGSKRHN